MYDLVTSIDVDERQFSITNNGDFRVILDCFSALNDKELTEEERIYASLMIFYDDINELADLSAYKDIIETLVKKMFLFFNCNQPTEKPLTPQYKLIDWEKDETLIMPAINNVAKKEIRLDSYVHWWTFMGYYMSIGDSVLATVVNIRSKLAKGKKLEKFEKEYRRENPQYFNRDFSVNSDSAEEFLNKVWNK